MFRRVFVAEKGEVNINRHNNYLKLNDQVGFTSVQV